MKHILEPLTRIPGVRTAALVTPDGVPISVHGVVRASPTGTAQGAQAVHKEQQTASDDVQALAALATGWIGETSRAVAPLSWDAPRRLVLRAARGTLVVLQAPGALLLVVLESGMSPEELRVPMESATLRMQRQLRSMGSRSSELARRPAAPSPVDNAPSQIDVDAQPKVLPSRPNPRTGLEMVSDEYPRGVSKGGNGVPEASGE
jgi:predicted regulator of Ras-like GTPase activity (Roadblock/LC7/MglB family)